MSELPTPEFGILLVDDEPAWLRSMGMTLEGPGGITNLHYCQDSRQTMDILSEKDIGVVLLDLNMPHLSGEELLKQIGEHYPETTVIVISGMNQVETAVACMKRGAFEYFVKTEEEDRLLDGVRRAIRVQQLERENRAMRSHFLSDHLDHPEAFAAIVTRNQAMQSIFRYIESVAPTSQPILITGESGVGKELFARSVHALSGRKGELVAVNIAGLDDNVFSDSLFGHTRGAFTGADRPRAGMIEKAEGGTLFLDEIGDLSPSSQVKLLRLLQEEEYYPLGSDVPKKMNARIVVATHQDLDRRQAESGFRKDLYYRLRGHQIHVPPLRERKEDLPVLLDHFLEAAALKLGKKKPTPPPQLAQLLSTYPFPGNVRELEAMVFDAVSTHAGRVLSTATFSKAIDHEAASPAAERDIQAANPFRTVEQIPTINEATELLIDEALERAGGNQSLAARLLGISQPALSKRLKQRRACGPDEQDDRTAPPRQPL